MAKIPAPAKIVLSRPRQNFNPGPGKEDVIPAPAKCLSRSTPGLGEYRTIDYWDQIAKPSVVMLNGAQHFPGIPQEFVMYNTSEVI